MSDTIIDIKTIAEDFAKAVSKPARRINICAGTGCVANGALKVFDALKRKLQEENLPVIVNLEEESEGGVHISKSGCQGFCQMGPLLTIHPENILYTKVKDNRC